MRTPSSKPGLKRRTMALAVVALSVAGGGGALAVDGLLKRGQPAPAAVNTAAAQPPPTVHSYTFTDCEPEEPPDASGPH